MNTLPTFQTVPLTRDRIAQFSAAMHDPNPVHLDPEFARSLGLPDVIAPGGMAVVAIAHAASLLNGPGAVREVDVTLKAPVQEGERLRCELGHGEGPSAATVLTVRALGDDGRVVAEGCVTVDLTPAALA